MKKGMSRLSTCFYLVSYLLYARYEYGKSWEELGTLAHVCSNDVSLLSKLQYIIVYSIRLMRLFSSSVSFGVESCVGR